MVDFLFDDIFSIEKVDPDGKKFDKVSRIVAQSEKHDVLLLLDVNTEIYPMHVKEKFLMVLSPTLEWSGAPVTGKRGQVEQKSLADKFEYIMHGLLYKMSTASSESSKGNPKASDEGSKTEVKVEVYASFGGLQMMLKGDPSSCTKFKIDQNLFLLIRKLM
ncbi:DNA-directed RNA polymerases II and V subunit 8A-like [Pyrus ussuriensis x Pyrus communis]|uniref:DNA-directed RNA polymerases II and V subunit 8A-like n=1 Tax=Pyrus ussuriensis x Pyrus communis TaxID=2448454 RepID=A0A5N5GUN0_9ROSA|nr:DNA-directed RNA polymerases II and V subunit 8A [Pyrus x bretschneideri]XP_048437882.1 DNA-directed RNA polymerases II and V subunit 8A [Pyrus x bretschneideri]KAB2617382.1 DNA-directed RNA polymerases II and V subunit 8A-like [Pyrus ussuriensis x Pyrus communis]